MTAKMSVIDTYVDPRTMGLLALRAERMGIGLDEYVQKIFAEKVDDTSSAEGAEAVLAAQEVASTLPCVLVKKGA